MSKENPAGLALLLATVLVVLGALLWNWMAKRRPKMGQVSLDQAERVFVYLIVVVLGVFALYLAITGRS